MVTESKYTSPLARDGRHHAGAEGGGDAQRHRHVHARRALRAGWPRRRARTAAPNSRRPAASAAGWPSASARPCRRPACRRRPGRPAPRTSSPASSTGRRRTAGGTGSCGALQAARRGGRRRTDRPHSRCCAARRGCRSACSRRGSQRTYRRSVATLRLAACTPGRRVSRRSISHTQAAQRMPSTDRVASQLLASRGECASACSYSAQFGRHQWSPRPRWRRSRCGRGSSRSGRCRRWSAPPLRSRGSTWRAAASSMVTLQLAAGGDGQAAVEAGGRFQDSIHGAFMPLMDDPSRTGRRASPATRR